MYAQENIKVKLITKPMKFLNYRPLEMEKYQQIVMANEAIFQGVMYEKGVADGVGWIGLPADNGQEAIEGQFTTYLHRGSYDQLEGAFQQIMTDYPEAQEFYLVYLNSPQEVAVGELRTKIMFHQGLPRCFRSLSS